MVSAWTPTRTDESQDRSEAVPGVRGRRICIGPPIGPFRTRVRTETNATIETTGADDAATGSRRRMSTGLILLPEQGKWPGQPHVDRDIMAGVVRSFDRAIDGWFERSGIRPRRRHSSEELATGFMRKRGGCTPALHAWAYRFGLLVGNITTCPRALGKTGSPVEITSVRESAPRRPDAPPRSNDRRRSGRLRNPSRSFEGPPRNRSRPSAFTIEDTRQRSQEPPGFVVFWPKSLRGSP